MSFLLVFILVMANLLQTNAFAQNSNNNNKKSETDISKDVEQTVSEFVYDKSTNGLDYTLFSGNQYSKLEIKMANASIIGDMHTNNNLVYNGSKPTIDGDCISAGKIEAKQDKVNITNQVKMQRYMMKTRNIMENQLLFLTQLL